MVTVARELKADEMVLKKRQKYTRYVTYHQGITAQVLTICMDTVVQEPSQSAIVLTTVLYNISCCLIKFKPILLAYLLLALQSRTAL